MSETDMSSRERENYSEGPARRAQPLPASSDSRTCRDRHCEQIRCGRMVTSLAASEPGLEGVP
jgi:hypothetical protein